MFNLSVGKLNVLHKTIVITRINCRFAIVNPLIVAYVRLNHGMRDMMFTNQNAGLVMNIGYSFVVYYRADSLFTVI